MKLLADSAEGVGYLLKDRISDVDEFVAAVRRVADGGSAIDPIIVSTLLSRQRAGRPARAAHPARARGARADGHGQLQPGHRRRARDHAARGREVRLEHLRQARPAVDAAASRGACSRCCCSCAPDARAPARHQKPAPRTASPPVLAARLTRAGPAHREEPMKTRMIQREPHTSKQLDPRHCPAGVGQQALRERQTTPSPRCASSRLSLARGLVHRRDGAFRLREEHLPAPRCRPRPADVRHGLARRHRPREPGRRRAQPAPPRAHRLRLPVVQPRPVADRGAEHHAAAAAREAASRRRTGSTR